MMGHTSESLNRLIASLQNQYLSAELDKISALRNCTTGSSEYQTAIRTYERTCNALRLQMAELNHTYGLHHRFKDGTPTR